MSETDLVPGSFTVGDLTLHAYDNRIFKDGKDIRATGKEYQVFCYLALRFLNKKPQVSRKELYDRVYGDRQCSRTIVEVFLGRLRHRLQDAKSNVWIEAVHNKGYSLKVVGANAPTAHAAE